MKTYTLPIALLVLFGTLSLRAAVISSTDIDSLFKNLSTTISNTDLLQTDLLSSSISDFEPVATFAPTSPNGGNLFDGIANSDTNIDGDETRFNGEAYIDNGDTTPWSVTFTLDTSVNTLGYNITGINSFSGWNSGLAGQDFTIEFSLVGSADFTSIGRFTHAADNTTLGVYVSENDSGILASGVDVIRFTHHTGASIARGSYRELDVLGSPTVIPEPSTLLLVGVAMGSVAVFRKRRR